MKTEERKPVDFLKDILESIEKIEIFIKGLEFGDFSKMIKPFMQSSGLLKS